ncbi:hypothetical protein EVAR_86427_1 [Eumeta japonica]|uniref:Uncharacterized protein n=1 Tax=Eumeta variegata TaxID=151549 RepID=A0A4C1Z6I1_EUMVA|nr:hypothetical protein EVAR_86427_1 [Eumeta japonica]
MYGGLTATARDEINLWSSRNYPNFASAPSLLAPKSNGPYGVIYLRQRAPPLVLSQHPIDDSVSIVTSNQLARVVVGVRSRLENPTKAVYKRRLHLPAAAARAGRREPIKWDRAVEGMPRSTARNSIKRLNNSTEFKGDATLREDEANSAGSAGERKARCGRNAF